MEERMWVYNVRATLQYGCPVWSCVIYLVEDSPIAESVLVQALPTGRVIHHFEFDVICLWADVLGDLIVKVSIAPTMEEARQHLLAVDEGEEDM